jgi:sugar/nucleoside kinase (ribokinase family)
LGSIITHCISSMPVRKRKRNPRVLGVGTIGLDYVAFVSKYPEPDAKIRSTSHAIGGGGNIGNTLTAICRLGDCDVSILAQVGDDANASAVVDELEKEGVDTSSIIRNPDIDTPFTYIIVDSSMNTRTCIHSPMETDMTNVQVDKFLSGLDGALPNHVHLDSRQTEASLRLIQTINNSVTISMDCEKYRPPHMRTLMNYCDVIFTNELFPSLMDWSVGGGVPVTTGMDYDSVEVSIEEHDNVLNKGDRKKLDVLVRGMVDILINTTKSRAVVTTAGNIGSLLLIKDDKMYDPQFSTSQCKPVQVRLQSTRLLCQAFTGYFCPAYKLEKHEIVDTTGAGDAFIGGFLSQFCVDSTRLADAMTLGTLCAAHKIKSPGAKQGLPHKIALHGMFKKFKDDFTHM